MIKKNFSFYLTLFWSTLSLSAFTFGGGYVIVPLMKKKFVDKLGWITENEMLDYIAIAQSSPGAIAVNTSLLVGWKLAGPLGAAVTLFGTILPPLVFLTVISFFYYFFATSTVVKNILSGMQAAVCAVMIDVVISLTSKIFKSKEIISILLMLAAFVAIAFFNVNVIYVILIAMFLGIMYSFKPKGGK